MSNIPKTHASAASRLTDEEVERLARINDEDYEWHKRNHVSPLAKNYKNVAAVLRDYMRMRKMEKILEQLMKADISKSEAPYHSLNVWGTDSRNGECGCNFYGEHVGYEIAWYWIKDKKKDYGSIGAANKDVLRRAEIFESIMNGMNALVKAQNEYRLLAEAEKGETK